MTDRVVAGPFSGCEVERPAGSCFLKVFIKFDLVTLTGNQHPANWLKNSADDKLAFVPNQLDTLYWLFAVTLLVNGRLDKRPVNECIPLAVGLQLLLGLVSDIRQFGPFRQTDCPHRKRHRLRKFTR